MIKITFSEIKNIDNKKFSNLFNQFMDENYNKITVSETFKHHAEEKTYNYEVTFYYKYFNNLKGYYGIVINQDVSLNSKNPSVQLYHISSNKNGELEPTNCYLFDMNFLLSNFVLINDMFYWCKNKDLIEQNSDSFLTNYKKNLYDNYFNSIN